MSYQGNTGDYGSYYKNKNKAEEKARLAELKKQKAEAKKNALKKGFGFSLPKFSLPKFNMPKWHMPDMTLPKIGKFDLSMPSVDLSKVATRRNGLYAGMGVGAIVAGMGIAALVHRNDPKSAYVPLPKIDLNARADSIRKADQRTADSLFNTIAADVGKTQRVLDSFYTVKLEAFDKQEHDKDDTLSISAMKAADATHELFVKDSALLVGGHPGVIFKVDNGFFTAEGKVRYNMHTLYTGKLTAQ